MQTIPVHPTRESIHAAKVAQQKERAQFEALTGICLDDDGRMLGLLLANWIWYTVNRTPQH